MKYDQLPDWFIAYDLFDKSTGRFVSRDSLAQILASTSIAHVNLIKRGTVRNIEELRALATGPSAYNSALREGIVVRVCEGDLLDNRMKVVRSDFIAGNERWNKTSKLAVNKLAIKYNYS